MGKIINNKTDVTNLGSVSYFKEVSPFPDADLMFTWVNCDYPYFHHHDHFEILVPSSGTLINIMSGKQFVLSPGDAFLIRPNDSHKIISKEKSSPAQHINFIIKCEYIKSYFSLISPSFYNEILTTNEPLKFNVSPPTLSHIIDSCLAIQSDKIPNEIKLFQTKLLANRLLNKFIENTRPLPSAYPEWLTQLLFALSNPKFEFDTDKLTEITGYSYSHLSRIFKELMGVSIIEYMRKIKLNYAADLLKNTDLNIIEIVFALNYNSVSYFNHSFKEYYGVTPTQMRKQKSV